MTDSAPNIILLVVVEGQNSFIIQWQPNNLCNSPDIEQKAASWWNWRHISDLDFWETKSVVQFSSLLQWCCASSVEQWLRTEPVQDGEHFLQLRGWPSPLIRKFIPGSPSPRSTPPWHMRCIPWNINTAFHIHSRAGPSGFSISGRVG